MVTHQVGETPGPGAYGRSISPKDLGIHSHKAQNAGKSFGKSGLTRDNSGIRMLATDNGPQKVATKARTRKQSVQMGEVGYIPKEVSMMSLK